MPKAIYHGVVIAESDRCETVEGNAYFPPDSVKREHLEDSETTTHCPWKGDAKYFNVRAEGAVCQDAAWCYPQTKDAAKYFEGYVAFWKDVTIEP